MTVPSEVNRAGPYTGNGVTTVFGYGFRILNAEHIRVIRATGGVEATLVNGADYTVSGVGSDTGGSVTMAVAPTAGQTITILRNVPFVQLIDLENQGAYYAETVEDAIDLLTMRDQQLAELMQRAVKVPASSDGDAGELSQQLSDDISLLAGMSADIATVSGVSGDVSDVADNMAAVQNVSNNMGAIAAANGSALNLLTGVYAGNGAATAFTLPGSASVPQNVLVWLDGVRQLPTTDYTVSGTTLTFVTAPANGAAVEILLITAVTMAEVLAAKTAAEAAAAIAQAAQNTILKPRGNWAAATAYLIGDMVYEPSSGASWYALVAHTSAAEFSTDQVAGRWQKFADRGASGAGSGDMLASQNLNDLANKAAARSNLGLAALAVKASVGASEIDDGSITIVELAAALVVTAAETIAANANDTTLPTSAAVKGYADGIANGVAGAARIQADAFPDFAAGNVEIINWTVPAGTVKTISRATGLGSGQIEGAAGETYRALKAGTLRYSIEMRKWGAYSVGADGFKIYKNDTQIASVLATNSWATYTLDFTFAAGDEISARVTVSSTNSQSGQTQYTNVRLLGDQRGLFRM